MDLSSLSESLSAAGMTPGQAADQPQQQPGQVSLLSGVDYSGKSLSFDTGMHAQLLINDINKCECLEFLNLRGNTLGVEAAEAIAEALAKHPELKQALWSDMFTGRMKTEIPKALSALGNGMMLAKARLTVLDLCDNAFGPIGVEGLAALLKSPVCTDLQELRLNNNGLGITGAKLLAQALTPAPANLKTLIMGRNRLENPGAIALAGVISTITKLENLSLPQNGIYHDGVKALVGALQYNPCLKVLNLNDNTVSIKGGKALGALLPSLPNLLSLNLGDCLLKTKGAYQILEALDNNCHLLKELDISSNEIGSGINDALINVLSAKHNLNCKIGDNPLGSELKQNLKYMGSRIDLSSGDGEEEDDDDDYEDEEDGEEDEDASGEEDEDDGEEGEEGEEEEEEEEEEEDEEENSDDDNESTVTKFNAFHPKLLEVSVVEDTQFVQTPESKFLTNPSLENLQLLSPDPPSALIKHLNDNMKDDLVYMSTGVSAAFCLLGLDRKEDAMKVLKHVCTWSEQRTGRQWSLSNMILINLKLMKSEGKQKIVFNLNKAISAFSSVFKEPWIPKHVTDTIKFFIENKKGKPEQAGDLPYSLYAELL